MGRGIHRTPTPALKTGDMMANDNQSKAELFCSTFFPPPPLLPKLPRETPRQLIDCPAITRGEIDSALKTTSNTSAPGPSGIGYHLLKTVWKSQASLLHKLLDKCLTLGHYPEVWRMSTVCMIRKPNKKDPSSPRLYRPITLEECLGKLLEKIIATRLQDSALRHNLLPLNQFGGCIKSGIIDARIDLCDEIQTATAQKLYVSVLCCDVKGFFDNVTLHPLQTSLSNMGLAPHLIRWITSFTSNRKVCIAFDGYTHSSLDKPN